MAVSRNQQLAIDKRNRMAQIETAYFRAKEYEKDPQFSEDKLKALDKIRSVVRQGLMENTEALQMTGRIQQIVLDTYQHENVIIEYEGLKKTLGEMFPNK